MNDPFRIAPITDDNSMGFVALVHAYLVEIAPDLDRPAQDKIAQCWRAADRDAFGFFDPLLFGFAIVRLFPGGTRELSEFYIAPAFRRRGYGKQAVMEVLRRFPGKWQLGVASGFDGASTFWEAALSTFKVKHGPPLTPHQSGSLHFTVTENT